MDWLKNPPGVRVVIAFLALQLVGEAVVNGIVGLIIPGNRGGGIGFCMVLAMQFAMAIRRAHPAVVTWPWMLMVAAGSGLLRALLAIPVLAALDVNASPLILFMTLFMGSANALTTLFGLVMGRRQADKMATP